MLWVRCPIRSRSATSGRTERGPSPPGASSAATTPMRTRSVPAPGPGKVEAYASYRAAWRALGRPEIDREELELSDGQLRDARARPRARGRLGTPLRRQRARRHPPGRRLVPTRTPSSAGPRPTPPLPPTTRAGSTARPNRPRPSPVLSKRVPPSSASSTKPVPGGWPTLPAPEPPPNVPRPSSPPAMPTTPNPSNAPPRPSGSPRTEQRSQTTRPTVRSPTTTSRIVRTTFTSVATSRSGPGPRAVEDPDDARPTEASPALPHTSQAESARGARLLEPYGGEPLRLDQFLVRHRRPSRGRCRRRVGQAFASRDGAVASHRHVAATPAAYQPSRPRDVSWWSRSDAARQPATNSLRGTRTLRAGMAATSASVTSMADTVTPRHRQLEVTIRAPCSEVIGLESPCALAEHSAEPPTRRASGRVTARLFGTPRRSITSSSCRACRGSSARERRSGRRERRFR